MGGLAAACFPSKRGILGLGILICMHSWSSSSLATSCFSKSHILLHLDPFHAFLLVFADIYEMSVGVIPKSRVPSFNFNSSTFRALKTVICGGILEACLCVAQQWVSCFCWLCKQTFWLFCQLCIDKCKSHVFFPSESVSQYLVFFLVCVVFVNWSEKNYSPNRKTKSIQIYSLSGKDVGFLLPSTLSCMNSQKYELTLPTPSMFL